MTTRIVGAVLVGLVVLGASCREQSSADAPQTSEATGGILVFVRVPEPLEALDRAAKYEDPLNAALTKSELGEVTGGGTMLGPPKADGSREIDWSGIDVELIDLDRGIGPLKQELIRLGVPKLTVLEYERDGKLVEELVH